MNFATIEFIDEQFAIMDPVIAARIAELGAQ